jgi:DNA-directed RNA polymerase subunit RPC12/RpoP
MDNITEYGCAQCGAQIMKPSLKPLASNHTPRSATKCDECGYVTDALKMRGFQCSTRIQSVLRQLCTADEIKQLRLHPNDSALSILNAKLIAKGKPALEVATTTPPTIREKA